MRIYVKSVVDNAEVVNYERNDFYYINMAEAMVEIEAEELDTYDIDGITAAESAIYAYLNNQDILLTTSDCEFSTSIINYDNFKCINLERYLLTKDKQYERLFALSHELGHFLDAKFNHNNDAWGFNAWYGNNTGTMELVAWAYGWEVLKALGMEHLKDEFEADAVKCLSSYVGFEAAIRGIADKEDIVKNYEEAVKECTMMNA